MYKFTLKHRVSTGKNLIDPYKIRQGYLPDAVVPLSGYDHTEKIEVVGGAAYSYAQKNSISIANRFIIQYNSFGEKIQEGVVDINIVLESGTTHVALSIQSDETGLDPEEACFRRGVNSPYTPFYTSREVYPIYKSLDREWNKQKDTEFFRDEIKGGLTFLKNDFDYILGSPFDTEFFIKIEDITGNLPDYRGYFFKTDCNFDSDNRKVDVKNKALDGYSRILAGLNKRHDLIKLNPETESLKMLKRPITQIYVAGDSHLTNIQGGNYWEQELQAEPVFDGGTLFGTYRFLNVQNILNIPTSYAPSLSINVTGPYLTNRESVSGSYRVIELSLPGFSKKQFVVQRVSDSENLYISESTDFRNPSINSVLFSGVPPRFENDTQGQPVEVFGGTTGEFYFTEYRVYSRLYTNLDVVENLNTEPVPSTDIIPNNSNYGRVIPYDFNAGGDRLIAQEQSRSVPTGLGRIPEGTPNAGQYYAVYASSGNLRPIPVTKSNWKALALWFVPSDGTESDEFRAKDEIMVNDTFSLHSVIQRLLSASKTNVFFDDSVFCSEFLYSSTNPITNFWYMGADYVPDINNTLVTQLRWLLTPKSNIININYTQAAKKAEISLQDVLFMLRDTMKLFWHVEKGRLRIEHISWYQNGGTYSGTIVGMDLTESINLKPHKKWSYNQNKFDYDKDMMSERFEFDWMDKVSPAFEGDPIEIISNYVQEGNIKDTSVGSFTTDVDYVLANPNEITKDGFMFFGARNFGSNELVLRRWQDNEGKNVIIQNGFLTWPYLHSKYFLNDMPSDNIVLNKQQGVLTDNKSYIKKQKVKFPYFSNFNPYNLVRTQIGVGRLKKISLNLESLMIDADLIHDIDANS